MYEDAIKDIIVLMLLDDYWFVNPTDTEPFSTTIFGQNIATFFSELPIGDEYA